VTDITYALSHTRYILLTTLQTLYAYFIEGDIVFVGKRKTFDKRVRSVLPRHASCLLCSPARWRM